MAEELTALWQEAEAHLRTFEQLARRTVEEAWLAGDALMRIKEKLPHGAWTPALKERGIAPASADGSSSCGSSIRKSLKLSVLVVCRLL